MSFTSLIYDKHAHGQPVSFFVYRESCGIGYALFRLVCELFCVLLVYPRERLKSRLDEGF